MYQTQKLKSQIDVVKSQLKLFAEIIPSTSVVKHTKDTLLDLLQKEFFCYKRIYDDALQKEIALGLEHDSDSSTQSVSKLLETNESVDIEDMKIKFEEEDENSNTSGARLTSEGVEDEDGMKETNVEKDMQDEVEDVYRSFHSSEQQKYCLGNEECTENNWTSEKLLHEKDELIREYRIKLEETDKTLQTVKRQNEDLEECVSSFKKDVNPMMKSISTGAPVLDESSQGRYLLALNKESLKFKRVLPKTFINCNINVREKYFLFNKCIKETYTSSSGTKVHKNLSTDEFQEDRHPIFLIDEFLEYHQQIYDEQNEYFLELKEKYDGMLEQLNTLGETEMKHYQTRKSRHIESVQEIGILSIENNIGLFKIDLTQTTRRLEFYTSRQRELLCLLNELTEKSEREQEELNKLQRELCTRKCDEERTLQPVSDRTALMDGAMKNYCKLSKCVEILDAKIWKLTETLLDLKETRCRQKQCRKLLRHSKEPRCPSVTTLLHRDREHSSEYMWKN